jgi:hypothetical protein
MAKMQGLDKDVVSVSQEDLKEGQTYSAMITSVNYAYSSPL